MMDFEVFKTKHDPRGSEYCRYVMQVEKVFYTVPVRWRSQNRVKLMALFKRHPDDFPAVTKAKGL